ncbi:MAG: hypothetical protein HKN45_09370 [Flavobacteriales bacterium]|nr:hypothetical protein [Flavobacteriales bacterium]
MPADLSVEAGKNEKELILRNSYPNEPKANNTEKLRVSKDRTELNRSPVISREALSNGGIRITTENKGKDDRKKALIRYVYQLGEQDLTIRKEVQFQGTEDWLKRSEYSYTRATKTK